MALRDEVRFFDENQAALRATYPDRFVVVKDGRVVSAHDSFEEAYLAAEDAGLSEFLIRSVDHMYATHNFINIS